MGSQRAISLQEDSVNSTSEVMLASSGGKASQWAPSEAQCDAIKAELDYFGGSLRVPGCAKERFCCDSWMNEFNRELKAQVFTNWKLQGHKIEVMLWKWIIRKGK